MPTTTTETPEEASGAPAAFSRRIARRLALWWGRPSPRWSDWRGQRDRLHRLRERYTFRHRDDPEAAWRCCAFWQRTVINKWNGRELAAKYGCPSAALYWHGRALAKLPLESLPSHFVIRPVWGTSRRGVYVVADGRELLRDESAATPQLRERLRRSRRAAGTDPWLVEEFVRSEDGCHRLPTEYKCHTFGDTVAAIQVIERTGILPSQARHRYYTPAWEPFADRMDTALAVAEPIAPPRCLDEMLHHAVTLGTALGTYMRIDFFATDAGCVLNEFSSTPGSGTHYTQYCDDFFGAFWAEKLPDAV
jgi:hypothetical protein